jgi:hypothetical protein
MINKNLHANKKNHCFLIEYAYTDAMLKNRASLSSSIEKHFHILMSNIILLNFKNKYISLSFSLISVDFIKRILNL